MAKRKNKKRKLSHTLNLCRANAAGIASTTKGRNTSFADRKKESNRKACRGRYLGDS